MLKFEYMNNTVTSKEELLNTAEKIILRDGIDKLNMRKLASECAIALGSVYNYFPSKTELIFEIIEKFWKSAFNPTNYTISQNEIFVDFFEYIFLHMNKSFKHFKYTFLSNITMIHNADKKKGKAIEKKYLTQVQKTFVFVLYNDKHIRENMWSTDFTADDFASFIIANMMGMLMRKEEDCTYLKEIICRILYENAEQYNYGG